MTTSEQLDECHKVELPFIDQLKSMGWSHIEGDKDVPYLTDRESFREVLLRNRLRKALQVINVDEDGRPWLDDRRINDAVGQLDRLGAHKLMEANQAALELLIKGVSVEGLSEKHGSRDQTVRFIDFKHPERNEFLVVNQFRVDVPGTQTFILPDIVLFINGIPVVVVECKSPGTTDPMEEGIEQLLRYSNQRTWVDADQEGNERLFHYNQLMVSTYYYKAKYGTIGAQPEHYMEWKDTSPVPMAEVAAKLGVDKLQSQQLLIAGMLRPAHLLDLIRNFTLFKQESGRTIKIAARYQQFRAVHTALHRLHYGQTRRENGEFDQRGGVIWHTQGSGKSLSMVFLVRKMRTVPELRRFKIVIVTDRIDLQDQLSKTAALTNETVRIAKNSNKLQAMLREPGADLVFAMIQKYQARDDDEAETIELKRPELIAAQKVSLPDKVRKLVIDTQPFPVLNESEEILVLVDEAHRSQTSDLHANLMRALPNCTKIGFTGTPIVVGKRKRTHEIFGQYIDRYTIKQSEEDESTVSILYEGRTTESAVANGGSLDQLFEDLFRERTSKELEAIKAKYATKGNVLEAPKMIAAKAEDILRHYVDNILPNGFKAQVVATSRRGAVRYHKAFHHVHQRLLRDLENLNPAILALSEKEQERQDANTQFLIRAYPYLATIRRLEFAAIISGATNDDTAWKEWTEKAKQKIRIERFIKPLVHQDEKKQDGLAFLIVKNMLLTGFDAPIEQVMYLDRYIIGHELLQAIARVNRVYSNKTHGLVVDYYGVGHHLKEALSIYSPEDIDGGPTSIKDELPKLADRHKRCLALFYDQGIKDIADVDACVELLRDERIRADFIVRLRKFLESLDIVMPRPEAVPYLRDAKILGFICKAAANLYRDEQLNILGAGPKVRNLIDKHIESQGVDPRIPPISILADDFEKAVDRRVSSKAKASEMEHAARYQIRKNFNDDPVHYEKLSKKLEGILQAFSDNWDQLVEELKKYVQEMRQGREADDSGLDPRTQAPFLDILQEEVRSAGVELNQERRRFLIEHTVEMVAHIAQEIRAVDFWRNLQAQNILRGWLIRFLDDNDIVSFETVERVADRLMELAKAKHSQL